VRPALQTSFTFAASKPVRERHAFKFDIAWSCQCLAYDCTLLRCCLQTSVFWRTCSGTQNSWQAQQPRRSSSATRSSSVICLAAPCPTPPSCSATWASWWVFNRVHRKCIHSVHAIHFESSSITVPCICNLSAPVSKRLRRVFALYDITVTCRLSMVQTMRARWGHLPATSCRGAWLCQTWRRPPAGGMCCRRRVQLGLQRWVGSGRVRPRQPCTPQVCCDDLDPCQMR
jgi:hypothetical protein